MFTTQRNRAENMQGARDPGRGLEGGGGLGGGHVCSSILHVGHVYYT